MKRIEVSDEVYAAIHRLTVGTDEQPNDILARLLNQTPAPDHPLLAYLATPEFRRLHKDADKYLAILGWVAAQHPADFREYILSITQGRRPFSMSQEEILAQSRYNQARQIPGTPYWAIMNIDTPTKRRFLTRVLDFCGYEETVVETTCHAIGMRLPSRRFAFLPR